MEGSGAAQGDGQQHQIEVVEPYGLQQYPHVLVSCDAQVLHQPGLLGLLEGLDGPVFSERCLYVRFVSEAVHLV